ncbi:hypothetical protein [Agriterribacter humi]|uniref:hypothetical protein n=1 Tax=Agriterribacter humi TaxID=1104781 RepID=UPI001264D4B5|nr:hypothetical protein [Agriterribacter humi]
MKKVKDSIACLYEKAVDVLVNRFETPDNLVDFIVDVLYSIRVLEAPPQPVNGFVDVGSLHFSTGLILKEITGPWMRCDKSGMREAMRKIHRHGGVEEYYHQMLRACSVHTLGNAEYGISKRYHNEFMANFTALFEVAFLFAEIEEMEEEAEREQKKAA